MPEIPGRLRPPRLTAAPASPALGEEYFDTTLGNLFNWNGTFWVPSSKLIYDSVDLGITLPIASLTTSTIPQTYKHLMVVYTARSSAAVVADSLAMRWNGISTAGYYDQFMQGSSTTVNGGSAQAATAIRIGTGAGASAGAPNAGSGVVFIPSYKDTTFYHFYTALSGYMDGTVAGNLGIQAFFGAYAAGTAISSLTFLFPSGGNIVAGSRFSIYGLV